MTLEELQMEMNELPCQDPEFMIGWLMSQVIYLINEREDNKMKKRNPHWQWLRSLSHKIVAVRKGKSSYTRKLKHKKEQDYG